MPKQTTHVSVVRQWCQSLGVLSAVSISREEAELKLRAYVPMLMDRFPDGAFTTASLEHVAAHAVKGFPTYGELATWLSDWWKEHRPLPPLLNGPAKEAPRPEPREPPTEEEVAYVHARVQQIVGAMRSPLSERNDDARPRPAYLSPGMLDEINPLPNGVKRVRTELVK